MSDWRKLRKEEADLICAIVRDSPWCQQVTRSLPLSFVQDMADSRMGSLRFKAEDGSDRRFGKEIGEVRFSDEDGVLVSATLNLDNNNELFELDIWKTDFSPLKRYPRPDEVQPLGVNENLTGSS